ncbi:XRE family transcriptional regulator [Candidatus Saccharibacteria bacterium]|jgi:transcriptional regulator with XRE-family HTH domain|nr:XRE family transcriptional regulator [Candidatus Saccharibacteria bacterium]NCU40841.1 XRE family transcriptional regulator [Candidatus Saccharibacteria bacterium]
MSDNSLHIIGRKLREVREKQHLTQSDVAEKADISTNHYAQIERGEANPSIETLESILKALNIKSSKVLPF